MKLKASIISLLLPVPALAACPSAAKWAEAFYTNSYSFYVGEPTAEVLSQVTEQFGALLSREAAYSGGEVGHLDYDPWLGAQDGEIQKPRFASESATPEATVVSMSYGFQLAPKGDVALRVTHLVLRKQGACWRLHDFITPVGESLSRAYSQP